MTPHTLAIRVALTVFCAALSTAATVEGSHDVGGEANRAPVVYGQFRSTWEDVAKRIVLEATDRDRDALTFTLVKAPNHGSLSGSAPDLTYAPAADYKGIDSFSFKANDGQSDSNVATVWILIRKNDRLLSVDLTLGDGGFDASLAAAKELHNQAVSVVVQWDELEPDVQSYDSLYLAQVNQIFAHERMSVTVGINPIDTVLARMPSDLRDKKMNDPQVIERYKQAVDFYLSLLKDVKVVAFVVGNEIDINLRIDRERWNEYEEFFKAVAPHIRSKLPGTPVGVKLTQPNLIGQARTFALSLNQHTDAVMVTYYPLNDDFSVKPPTVIGADVGEIMTIYPERSVYFLEFGYPSSGALGSSEDKQAEAVREMFKSWDVYSNRIPVMSWFGISDFTRDDLDRIVSYYGIGGGSFREYLGTLGIMKADGTRKKAFAVFKAEAEARGW